MIIIRRQMLTHFPTVTQSAGFQPEPSLTQGYWSRKHKVLASCQNIGSARRENRNPQPTLIFMIIFCKTRGKRNPQPTLIFMIFFCKPRGKCNPQPTLIFLVHASAYMYVLFINLIFNQEEKKRNSQSKKNECTEVVHEMSSFPLIFTLTNSFLLPKRQKSEFS